MVVILIFWLFFKEISFSQELDTTKYISLSAKYSTGYIYAHHESLKYFINDYVPAFEANIGFRKKGDKIWHKLYRYPTVGLGYYHAELGNPEVLGHVDAVFYYLNIPVIERKNFKLFTKYAVGVAWLNKSFDLYENKYNIAIGSKLNAYLNLNLESEVKLSKQIYLLAGLGLTHYSNGGTSQPNLGLNVISVSAGLLYNIQKEEFKKIEPEIPRFKKRNEYSLILSAGVKTLQPARTHRYLVSSLSFNAERQFSYKGMFGVGIDLFKDNSRNEYLKETGVENPTTADLFYAGAHASYDFVFGRASFTVQMGGYFFNRAKSFQAIYNRFGLKYRFAKHLMANLTLRTYWASADFAEWGIGYRF